MITDISRIRVGIGYDVHPFAEGGILVIGGERLNYSYGLSGHSDADVLVHAVIDSLAGSAGLGDIGQLFPNTDEKYRDISSIELLKNVYSILLDKKIEIINIDSTVICEEPRIAPHVDQMKSNISEVLNGLAIERIGIKGKTTEKLGFTGRGEGIAACAVSLIYINE